MGSCGQEMAFMLLNKHKSADYSCNQLIFPFWLFPEPYLTNLRQKTMQKWGGKKNSDFGQKYTLWGILCSHLNLLCTRTFPHLDLLSSHNSQVLAFASSHYHCHAFISFHYETQSTLRVLLFLADSVHTHTQREELNRLHHFHLI